jgi:RimJ/RimL family protein N-acetyltransferase
VVLRPWRDEDYAPYAALNADPEVRRYWAATLTMEESDTQAAEFQKHIEEYGFGFWAAEAGCRSLHRLYRTEACRA